MYSLTWKEKKKKFLVLRLEQKFISMAQMYLLVLFPITNSTVQYPKKEN